MLWSNLELDFILSAMLEWGMHDMLRAQELRCMRLVCHQLRQAVNVYINTLALRIDATTHDTPTTTAMALFHCGLPAAKHLHVHVPYSASACWQDVHERLDVYRAHSLVAGSPLLAVKHCCIRIAAVCPQQLAPQLSLLQALPLLEGMALQLDAPCHCCKLEMSTQLFRVLAGFRGLHTLACGSAFSSHAVVHAAGQAQDLHTLSMDHIVPCSDLALLSTLPSLEYLRSRGVHHFETGMQLPRLRTLHAGRHAAGLGVLSHVPLNWHPSMTDSISVETSVGLAHMTRLEGYTIEPKRASKLLQVPAIVQRLARCARHWALHMDWETIKPADIAQHLEPGCLPRLRTLSLSGMATCAALSQGLSHCLAAAPQAEAVYLRYDGLVVPGALATLLEPLQQAAHLHTLWLSVDHVWPRAHAPGGREMLLRIWRNLTQPSAGQGRRHVRCPSLTLIGVGCNGNEWPPELQLTLKLKAVEPIDLA